MGQTRSLNECIDTNKGKRKFYVQSVAFYLFPSHLSVYVFTSTGHFFVLMHLGVGFYLYMHG